MKIFAASAFILVAILALSMVSPEKAEACSGSIFCKNVSCQADPCPAGTASQEGSCHCAATCRCTGSIICYNALGVVIAHNACAGECARVQPAPGLLKKKTK